MLNLVGAIRGATEEQRDLAHQEKEELLTQVRKAGSGDCLELSGIAKVAAILKEVHGYTIEELGHIFANGTDKKQP